MKKLPLMLIVLVVASPLFAQEEVVFKGLPEIKISEGGTNRTPEKLSKAKALEFECIIKKMDDKYYWVTRENVELTPIESGGFITFLAVNGSGCVRIIKPEMKKLLALIGETEEKFDYIEHLLLGLRTITYYGKSTSLIAQDNVVEDEAFTALIQAKALKCILGKGCSANWGTGDPHLEIGKWSNNKDDCVLLFDSIDLKKGTARLIGSQGATDVMVFSTLVGITFIETTGFGNMNITTVFADYKKGTKDYIFVHSRHMRVIKPLPSQYHGACKIVIN